MRAAKPRSVGLAYGFFALLVFAILVYLLFWQDIRHLNRHLREKNLQKTHSLARELSVSLSQAHSSLRGLALSLSERTKLQTDPTLRLLGEHLAANPFLGAITVYDLKGNGLARVLWQQGEVAVQAGGEDEPVSTPMEVTVSVAGEAVSVAGEVGAVAGEVGAGRVVGSLSAPAIERDILVPRLGTLSSLALVDSAGQVWAGAGPERAALFAWGKEIWYQILNLSPQLQAGDSREVHAGPAVGISKLYSLYFSQVPETSLYTVVIEPASTGASYVHQRIIRNSVYLALFVFVVFLIVQNWSFRRRMAEDQRLAGFEHLTAMGELAATMTHEVRNPLTAARGFLQLLEDDLQGEECDRVKLVLEELNKINEVLENFLGVARSAGEAWQQVNLNQLLVEVVRLEQPYARRHGITITLDLDHSLGEIKGKPRRLKQVVLNLLQNAVHSMDKSGRITLSSGALPGKIAFKVADEGRGIPARNFEKIFQPFYTTREEGTGLGLSTCRQIVAEHGGIIEVQSGEGQGSTFTVTLPG